MSINFIATISFLGRHRRAASHFFKKMHKMYKGQGTGYKSFSPHNLFIAIIILQRRKHDIGRTKIVANIVTSTAFI